jgi:hypothetical protein
VKSICWAIFLSTVNDDLTASYGFFCLGQAYFADGNGSGNTHDGGCDKILSWDTKTDVGGENGTGDGRETLIEVSESISESMQA